MLKGILVPAGVIRWLFLDVLFIAIKYTATFVDVNAVLYNFLVGYNVKANVNVGLR